MTIDSVTGFTASASLLTALRPRDFRPRALGRAHREAVLAVTDHLCRDRRVAAPRSTQLAHQLMYVAAGGVQVHPLPDQRRASAIRAAVAIGGKEPQAAFEQDVLELLGVLG
jgi:hypothetical protein